MATSAGSIVVDLDANSVKLLRELAKAQRKTKKTASNMRKSMGRAFSAIRTSILSAGTALAAFGAIRGLTRVTGEIDKIGKLVDRLGGSTEAFSELQFVAERSGLAFNTLTMGLQRMSRRVAEAAAGFGEAKGALAELRINAEALNKLPIDRQLEVIADALAGVKVDADKTRLAMKLFDSEGVALLQTMKAGGAGIRELRDEAKRLGVSLSGEQVAAATAATDAMTGLNASTRALSISLANALAPALTTVIDKMQLLISGPSGAHALAEEMDVIRKRIELLGNKPIHALEVKALLERFGDLAKRLESLENGTASYGDTTEELGEIFVTAAKKVTDYDKALGTLRKRYTTAEQDAESLRQVLRRFGDDLSGDEVRLINAEIFEILTSGIEEISIKGLPKLKKATKDATDAMSEYSKQAARNMQDAFAEFLFDPFEDGVKGMLKGFLDAIRRMVAEQASASFFKSSGIGGFIGNIFGKASGGPVAANTPYMVGEMGPELFVPSSSGSIVANGAMGGVVVNQNYHIEAGADWGTLQQVLPPMFDRNRETTVAEIRNRINEGSL